MKVAVYHSRKGQRDVEGNKTPSKPVVEFPTQFICSNTTYVLARFLRCSWCQGDVIEVNGRNCYGCYNACEKTCNNSRLILKEQIEEMILNDLKRKFLFITTPNHVGAVFVFKDIFQSNGSQIDKESFGRKEHSIDRSAYYVARTSIQTLALLNEKS